MPQSAGPLWEPLGYAQSSGLLVATVLTLLFLPALYAAWFKVRRDESHAT